MRYLKALINSLISGIFFSFLLALLIYNLNINLNFKITFLPQLALSQAISYGLLVSLLCFLVFFIFQFLIDKKIKIAIISPLFLSFSLPLLILIFLAIFRANYGYYLSIFNSEIRTLLKSQMIILFSVAVLGLLTFFVFYYYRKNFLFFWVYFTLFIAVFTFIFIQRLNYPIPPILTKVANFEAKKIDKKITIIGLEGLSFNFIIPLISEGKLPNFSWFVEEGSWGKLKNFSPNEPIILNSSFNTGKYPFKHRQISLYSYQLSYFKEEIEIVPRYILFRQLTKLGLLKIPSQKKSLYSNIRDIWKIFEDNKITFLKRDWPYGQERIKPSQKAEKLFAQFFKDLQYETGEIFSNAKEAFFSDCQWENKALQEKNKINPQFFYLLLNGLNIVETYFYKFSFPDSIDNIEQEDINKFRFVIEKYYQFYDQIIGKYLASLKEDELLIVYSPHGIEPLPLWKRFVEWILGNGDVSAYHEMAPEGVIFFYGKGIAKGKNIEQMKIIDIAPTLLYYLGLPVGKDMDGIVISPIFEEEFTSENPIFYISSYEEIFIKAPQ